ncbi:hypothetical protein BE21_08230 [Sorangium cellulosum]|uniref:Uncharacterized protein n=1 Tax=Sorangium cellulosum TaxID=56 RepID=A0A150U2R7_SORCE|nr:hypothetical protein BE21_08230 [Sorangium cellulosum]
MRFTVEAAGKSSTFDGVVRYGGNRATLEMSLGGQAKLVEFLCSAHGVSDGYGELDFDLALESGDRLGGCQITSRGRDIGLIYLRGPR